MVENEFRSKQKEKPEVKTNGKDSKTIFSGSGKLEEMFDAGVPIQFMPKILFVAGLLLLYIMNSYIIEKNRIRIERTKTEVEDLRTDYTTMKADYMFKSKQSEVEKRVAVLGLKASSVTPIRIAVIDQE